MRDRSIPPRPAPKRGPEGSGQRQEGSGLRLTVPRRVNACPSPCLCTSGQCPRPIRPRSRVAGLRREASQRACQQGSGMCQRRFRSGPPPTAEFHPDLVARATTHRRVSSRPGGPGHHRHHPSPSFIPTWWPGPPPTTEFHPTWWPGPPPIAEFHPDLVARATTHRRVSSRPGGPGHHPSPSFIPTWWPGPPPIAEFHPTWWPGPPPTTEFHPDLVGPGHHPPPSF